MDSGGQKSLTMAYLRNLDSSKVQFELVCDSDSNSLPFEEVEQLGGKLHEYLLTNKLVNILRHWKNCSRKIIMMFFMQ